jgi:hypothetical protein
MKVPQSPESVQAVCAAAAVTATQPGHADRPAARHLIDAVCDTLRATGPHAWPRSATARKSTRAAALSLSLADLAARNGDWAMAGALSAAARRAAWPGRVPVL